MDAVQQLHILDIRSLLPRAAWSIGTRDDDPTSATIHFNGPPVLPAQQTGKRLLTQLAIDARYQMRPGGLGAKNGGDGLQYHITVDPITGQLYQTRDYNAELWHCRNVDGNAHSLSIQFPIGGAQDVTDAAWESATGLFNALMLDYGWQRTAFKGHQEWSSTECPGDNLMRRLQAWRAGGVYRGGSNPIVDGVACAYVRQGPARSFAIAAKMYPKDMLVWDAVTSGESVGGDTRWLHRADGLGFVHASLVKEL